MRRGHLHPEQLLPMLLFAHPLVQKDKCLQEVVDACADFLWGEVVQQQLQGLHTLCHQVDVTILHWAGQEAQQTWMPQGLQVLQKIKICLYFTQKVMQVIENPWAVTDNAVCKPKPLISNLNRIQTAVNGKHKNIFWSHWLYRSSEYLDRWIIDKSYPFLCLKYNVLNKPLCLVQQVGHVYVHDTKQRLYNITLLQLQQQLLRLSVRHGARMRFQYNYLGSFVDFVLIASLVNKHGSGLSILEYGRVHGESWGQGQQWLLQGTASHRAALRTHGRVCFWTWRAMRGTEGRKIC